MGLTNAGPGVDDAEVAEQVEIQAKYAGYIDRQQQQVARAVEHEQKTLPSQLDYSKVVGLSTEVKQRLREHCPQTIGQAARIPGVTPAAISLLLVHLKKTYSAGQEDRLGGQ